MRWATSRCWPIFNANSTRCSPLVSVFEQWMPFLQDLPPKPEIKVALPDTDRTGSTGPDDKAKRLGDSHDQTRTPDEPAASDDVQLHAAVALDLEQMQTGLALPVPHISCWACDAAYRGSHCFLDLCCFRERRIEWQISPWPAPLAPTSEKSGFGSHGSQIVTS